MVSVMNLMNLKYTYKKGPQAFHTTHCMQCAICVISILEFKKTVERFILPSAMSFI